MFNTGEYTLTPWKVGWKYIASELTCAVIPQKREVTIADHRVIHVSCASEDEAYFVCGALNSTFARLLAGFFIIETQIAPQVLDNIRIPKFDPGSRLHLSIVAEAKRLSDGAPDAVNPIHENLDSLCKVLWAATDAELQAVEAAYRELYQQPSQQNSSESQQKSETEQLD
jgi:hypothetical protein